MPSDPCPSAPALPAPTRLEKALLRAGLAALGLPSLRVVLLTARPERVHHLTEAWLEHYRIRWDLLVMRPHGDYDVARAFKQTSVEELREFGFELRLAIEDDRENVAMFRAAGVPCLYMHSGYYD